MFFSGHLAHSILYKILLVAVITSTGTLDKRGTVNRNAFAEKAELVGAIRHTAFASLKGTRPRPPAVIALLSPRPAQQQKTSQTKHKTPSSPWSSWPLPWRWPIFTGKAICACGPKPKA